MSEFSSLAPNLIVHSVNDMIDYYVGVLGFKLEQTNPEEGVFEWAMVRRDEVTLMFQTFESIQSELADINFVSDGARATYFITMKRIEEYYESIKDKAEIVMELKTTFYGSTEFAITDPEGHVLAFAEFKGR